MDAGSEESSNEDALERWSRERWDHIGDLDPGAGTTPANPHFKRRTVEDCIRETEEFKRLGIEVICTPTWEGIEAARAYVKAREEALAEEMRRFKMQRNPPS